MSVFLLDSAVSAFGSSRFYLPCKRWSICTKCSQVRCINSTNRIFENRFSHAMSLQCGYDKRKSLFGTLTNPWRWAAPWLLLSSINSADKLRDPEKCFRTFKWIHYPSKQPPVKRCRNSSRLVSNVSHTWVTRRSVILDLSWWTTSGLSMRNLSNKAPFSKHNALISVKFKVSCLIVHLPANIVIGRGSPDQCKEVFVAYIFENILIAPCKTDEGDGGEISRYDLLGQYQFCARKTKV